MPTITLENAPKGGTFAYQDYILIKKTDPKAGLEILTKSFYSSDTDSYGPFEGKNAINFLKIGDHADQLS